MKFIKPPALQAGQNLGIVALSNSAKILKKDFRERAYRRIHELFGLNIIEAPNLDVDLGHAAGSIKDRVKSLHQFFKRKDIHGIMSFWGGANSHQILEYLDYDLIKKNPKVMIGYSDTTSVLAAIHAKTGLVTFNGPAVITFAKPSTPKETMNCFRSLLMEKEGSFQYPTSKSFSDHPWWVEDRMDFIPNPGMQCYRKGKAEGPIVGGNVGTLLLLAGTPYWPSMKGKILFVEDDEAESSQSLDRFFTQLRHMGVYDQIQGLVIGRFARSVGLKESDSLVMILDHALKGYKFPVLTEFDMGHTDPLMTIPLGIQARMDAGAKQITLLEKVTK